MAKIYGNRWRLVGNSLGEGGQAHVFRVIDTTGAHTGEFALKRIKNLARTERFKREVEAIQRINHPNIVRLIDHSSFEAADDEQFIVMEIAAGGDLSSAGKAAFYKGSLDTTLLVAKQLALGLAAAHEKQIIHRDVKPQNVLFTGTGHNVLLTDFGICLIRDDAHRPTQVDEKPGPQSFIAPELDEHGQLDAEPTADVYSLGKVIYYLFSGGVIVPRERLHEERYSAIFKSGQRHQLFRRLLGEMICGYDERFKTMSDVLQGLQRIEEWEQTAQSRPLSASTLDSIHRLQNEAEKKRQVLDESTTARGLEQDRLAAVRQSFKDWASEALRPIAEAIAAPSLSAAVAPIDDLSMELNKILLSHNSFYEAAACVQLAVAETGERHRTTHLLKLVLYKKTIVKVVMVSGDGHTSQACTPRDFQLAFIPVYARQSAALGGKESRGFFSQGKMIGNVMYPLPTLPGIPRDRQMSNRPFTLLGINANFFSSATLHLEFNMSTWPPPLETLNEIVERAVETFIDRVASEGAIENKYPF
jgi:serine/threonine protein kinase